MVVYIAPQYDKSKYHYSVNYFIFFLVGFKSFILFDNSVTLKPEII